MVICGYGGPAVAWKVRLRMLECLNEGSGFVRYSWWGLVFSVKDGIGNRASAVEAWGDTSLCSSQRGGVGIAVLRAIRCYFFDESFLVEQAVLGCADGEVIEVRPLTCKKWLEYWPIIYPYCTVEIVEFGNGSIKQSL
jgi:hypothetical protein